MSELMTLSSKEYRAKESHNKILRAVWPNIQEKYVMTPNFFMEKS